jgi:hypothetical protein
MSVAGMVADFMRGYESDDNDEEVVKFMESDEPPEKKRRVVESCRGACIPNECVLDALTDAEKERFWSNDLPSDDDDDGPHSMGELMGWTEPKRKTKLVREFGDVFVAHDDNEGDNKGAIIPPLETLECRKLHMPHDL